MVRRPAASACWWPGRLRARPSARCATRGPLLADAAPVHAGTAVAAIVMTGLVMIGLVMRPQGRVLRALSWVSVGLLATYVLTAALAFLHGEN